MGQSPITARVDEDTREELEQLAEERDQNQTDILERGLEWQLREANRRYNVRAVLGVTLAVCFVGMLVAVGLAVVIGGTVAEAASFITGMTAVAGGAYAVWDYYIRHGGVVG